jgi:phosphopantothenoylcysteine decarboxylase
LRLIAPVSKELACGDVGVGALAPVDMIVHAVEQALGPLRS